MSSLAMLNNLVNETMEMKRLKSKQCAPNRQSGVAILTITILLLLVATIGTLMVGNVGLQEQKIAGTDVRSKEVYSAAVGGMEYGVDWYNDNFDNTDLWSDADDDGDAEIGDTGSPTGLADVVMSADTYNLTITYTLLSDMADAAESKPIIIRISSTATAVGDTHITKTVHQEVMTGQTDYLSGPTNSGVNQFDGPPLVVEDCAYNFRGNPDIFPNDGVAIGSTQGDSSDPSCLDNGTHLDIHGGSLEFLSTQLSLWDTVFGPDMDEDDLRAMEGRSPELVHFVDSTYPHYPSQPPFNGNNWHNSLGSEDEPVIVYFDSTAGCPNINGGPTIYGLVYYEIGFDDPDDLDNDGDREPQCTYNGWGGATIYGTVAVSGEVTGMNANGQIIGTTLDFSGGGGGDDDSSYFSCGAVCKPLVSEIPGSWRDY